MAEERTIEVVVIVEGEENIEELNSELERLNQINAQRQLQLTETTQATDDLSDSNFTLVESVDGLGVAQSAATAGAVRYHKEIISGIRNTRAWTAVLSRAIPILGAVVAGITAWRLALASSNEFIRSNIEAQQRLFELGASAEANVWQEFWRTVNLEIGEQTFALREWVAVNDFIVTQGLLQAIGWREYADDLERATMAQSFLTFELQKTINEIAILNRESSKAMERFEDETLLYQERMEALGIWMARNQQAIALERNIAEQRIIALEAQKEETPEIIAQIDEQNLKLLQLKWREEDLIETWNEKLEVAKQIKRGNVEITETIEGMTVAIGDARAEWDKWMEDFFNRHIPVIQAMRQEFELTEESVEDMTDAFATNLMSNMELIRGEAFGFWEEQHKITNQGYSAQIQMLEQLASVDIENREKYYAFIDYLRQLDAEKQAETTQAEIDGRIEVAKAYFTAASIITGTLANLLEQQGANAESIKAIRLFEAILNTAAGATYALLAPWPANLVAWAQVVATGLTSVATILRSDIGSTDTSGLGAGGGGGGVGTRDIAPSFSIIQPLQQPLNQLTGAIDNMTTEPARAYVTQDDIDNNAELDRRIRENATS